VAVEIRKETDEDGQEDDDWQEKRVQRLLDPIYTASKE
jgi:hypothetical protein